MSGWPMAGLWLLWQWDTLVLLVFQLLGSEGNS